jgi:hypothetical protein
MLNLYLEALRNLPPRWWLALAIYAVMLAAVTRMVLSEVLAGTGADQPWELICIGKVRHSSASKHAL